MDSIYLEETTLILTFLFACKMEDVKVVKIVLPVYLQMGNWKAGRNFQT